MKGFIFRCNEKTKGEVFERKLFGEEMAYLDLVRAIDDDYLLFLYNTKTFEFSGPYKPASKGALDLEKYAWIGAFRAQIRFEETDSVKTIPFAKIEHVIKVYRRNIYPHPFLDEGQLNAIVRIMGVH